MSWSRFDDLYDDHPKVMAATHSNPLAAALHPQAITAASRRESDGLVDPFWLLARAPDKRKRTEALSVLVRLRLFDVLPAGEAWSGEDDKGHRVTIGPFDEDRHLVHDYLDFNPSSAQLQERRRLDAERKANGRRKDSDGSPAGHDADSAGSPVGPRGRAGADPRPTPHPSPSPSEGKSVGDARELAPSEHAEYVADVLRQCPRLHVDRIGVENAIAAWPNGDPIQAAREVVTWATDPAFQMTNAARALTSALSKQQRQQQRPRTYAPKPDPWSTENILAAGAALAEEQQP